MLYDLFSVVTTPQQTDISAADIDDIINIVNSPSSQIDLNQIITNPVVRCQVTMLMSHYTKNRSKELSSCGLI